jgi:hypothetical protein
MSGVKQNLFQHSNHILRDHILCDFFTFHIASQVEHNADHQVSESVQVHFVGGILGDLSLQSVLKLLYDHIKNILFFD